MSLKPMNIEPVPEETAKVARAAFAKGNIYMKMRDEFGPIYEDNQFASLFPSRGQPAEAPWRLALITVMQFSENLTDRQAADAVRGRIDWKYALSLPLEDPGFDFSVLSKFRTRLLENQAENLLFEQLVLSLQQRDLIKAAGKQRTDSTHILAAVRRLNRLELVGETLRSALEALAVVAPDWLRQQVTPDWFERYGQAMNEYRLPQNEIKQAELAKVIGQDGSYLLSKIYAERDLSWLRTLEAVQTLRQIWIQQYYQEGQQVQLRAEADTPPPSLRIASPYDPEARRGKKRSQQWLGYKVHLTETCDEDQPRLITNVETYPAPNQDYNATAVIHQNLQARQLLPAQHIVDAAYISGPLIVSSQVDFGIELVGPVLPDNSWQAVAQTGFDLPKFQIDWPAQIVTCPVGKTSIYWSPEQDRNQKSIIHVHFSAKDCHPCQYRLQCTQSKTHGRMLSLRPQKEHEAIQTTRTYQQTVEFKEKYDLRAGVEGTISQSAFALGMRRSRYRGLAKTRLHHLATAAAINLKRAVAWLFNLPLATTRTSRFAALAP